MLKDLRSLVEQERQKRAQYVSLIRGDAKRDAYAQVRRPKFSRDIVLPDHTKKFKRAIKEVIPDDGRIIFVNIPIFANPGEGKTATALTIVFELLEHYGRDKVSVYISDHIPSLVDAMAQRASPVVILFVDDALKEYSSRDGGSSEEQKEARKLFTTLRHEFAKAHNVMDGIVYVIFTSQMYKGLEKVYREGFVLFKSALTSDKQEIMPATQMGQHAWRYLEEILRDVKVKKKKERMSDSVVIIPGYPAGRLHLPMRESPVLEEVLKEIEAKSEVPEEIKKVRVGKALAPKYKIAELAWRIKRTRLTPKEQMARINGLMDKYAREFVKENADTSNVQTWLANRVHTVDLEEERRIPTADYLELTKPKTLDMFKKKIDDARKRLAMERIKGEGVDLTGDLSDNDLADYVARALLEEGFNPYDRGTKDSFMSRLYKFPAEIRGEIFKGQMKSVILSRTKEMWVGENGLPQKGGNGASGGYMETPEFAQELAEKVDLGDAQFDVDSLGLLEKLIEKARIAQNNMLYRALMIFKAVNYLDKYGGRTLSNDTEIAETKEGEEWQKENFGEARSRPVIQKSRSKGAGYFYNQRGLLYEAWVAKKLRDGYMVKDIFDRAPIKEVIHEGGNDHEPDIVVVYEDGTKDFVSLKCYETKEPISITTDPRKTDEIQPERHAWREAQARGEEGNRIVVLLRNLAYEGFQVARVFQSAVDIPTTLGFNRGDIGYFPWVAPERAGQEDGADEKDDEDGTDGGEQDPQGNGKTQ